MLNSNTTDKIVQTSTGFLNLLKNASFLFWLALFQKIMPHVEILYNQMQSKNDDANKIQKSLNEFYVAILNVRNSKYCESTSSNKAMESKEVR